MNFPCCRNGLAFLCLSVYDNLYFLPEAGVMYNHYEEQDINEHSGTLFEKWAKVHYRRS